WSDPGHLREAVSRWRDVLIEKRTGMLVMDSAPTAMLASLGLPMKRVWLGNHWSTPPRVSPMPDLQARLTGQARPIPDTEPAVVEAINNCLADQGQPPIEHLYELFDRADASPMLSIPEIDPHGPRDQTEYLGIWGSQPGIAPPWPTCSHGPDTPGVIAYLKPFKHRAATLKLLAETGLPVLAFTPKLCDSETDAATGSNIQLYTEPIDWLAKQAGAAFIVCHAGAGMTGQALQLGLPVLALPTSLEQTAVAVRAAQSGACIAADINEIASIGSAMEQMLTDEKVLEAAEVLGKKYDGYDPASAAQSLADQLLTLV
ncbi:MAG: glycosyltransferase, partial [Phycisphaeraceae bacterium]